MQCAEYAGRVGLIKFYGNGVRMVTVMTYGVRDETYVSLGAYLWVQPAMCNRQSVVVVGSTLSETGE